MNSSFFRKDALKFEKERERVKRWESALYKEELNYIQYHLRRAEYLGATKYLLISKQSGCTL